MNLAFKWLFSIGVVFLVSGCVLSHEQKSDGQGVLVTSKSNQQIEPASESKKRASKSVTSSMLSHIDGATMFEIMAAEMLVQKGRPVEAFDILYPLTKRLKDIGLAERLFQISMATYREKRIEKATLLWREIAPKSAVAWRASFVLSLRKGEVNSAIQEWEKYKTLSNKSLDEVFITSAAKIVNSVPSEAGLLFFQKLSHQYDQAWSVYYGLALVAHSYKKPQIGIAALDKAKTLLPKAKKQASLPAIYDLLSRLYLISDTPEKGIEALQSFLNIYPNNLLLQERVARLEVKAKRYDAAEKRYQLILTAEPRAYTSQLSLALLQLERRAYSQSEKNLLEVADQKAYQSVGSYYLGVLYQEQERFFLALKYFKQVVAPNYRIDAQLHLAEIYFAMNEPLKANKTLDEIDVSQPANQVKVLRAKAIFLNAEKQPLKAIKLYDKALQIEPENIELLKAQTLLFYKQNMFDQYENNLLQVLKVDQNDVDALNALGYYYVEHKIKMGQAQSLLQRALQIEPNSYYILDSMGWYYYQINQFDKALGYLNKAFSQKQDDEVFIHLVSAYWKSGNVNRAKSLWKNNHQKFLQNDRVQNLINDLESGMLK